MHISQYTFNTIYKETLLGRPVTSGQIPSHGFLPRYLHLLSNTTGEIDAQLAMPYASNWNPIFYSNFYEITNPDYSPLNVTGKMNGYATDYDYTIDSFVTQIKNESEIAFPLATTDWGTITHVAYAEGPLSGGTYGGLTFVNLLFIAKLDTPEVVYAGDKLRFPTNAITIRVK